MPILDRYPNQSLWADILITTTSPLGEADTFPRKLPPLKVVVIDVPPPAITRGGLAPTSAPEPLDPELFEVYAFPASNQAVPIPAVG